LEGSIKIFKYGYKIKEKIDAELNPEFDEPTQVFDLFEGKNFEMIITKQAGYNNYDSSKFQGKRTSMLVNGNAVEKDAEGRKQILDYLNAAPSLDSFDYKPWDDATRAKIEEILNQYRSPGSAISTVSKKAETSMDSSFDNFGLSESKSAKPAASAPAASASEESDDLDEFLKGLDI
jgi:hypothetical protein